MSRIDDVNEAIEVVGRIINGVKELKFGGFKTADEVDGAVVQAIEEMEVAISDEVMAKMIFDSWQSIEVTNRTLAKGAFKGSSSITKEDIVGFITKKEYGYADGMAKFFKVDEGIVRGLIDELVKEKKLWKPKDKNYYKISTYKQD